MGAEPSHPGESSRKRHDMNQTLVPAPAGWRAYFHCGDPTHPITSQPLVGWWNDDEDEYPEAAISTEMGIVLPVSNYQAFLIAVRGPGEKNLTKLEETGAIARVQAFMNDTDECDDCLEVRRLEADFNGESA